MRVRDLIPPILMAAGRRLRSPSGPKLYPSYEAALVDCSERAYSNDEIIDVVLEKTLRYREELSRVDNLVHLSPTNAYSLCSLLMSIGVSEIKVIDFGGACGAHYFLTRAVLPQRWKLRWVVVETPAMAIKAAAVLANEELSFSSDLSAAARSIAPVNLLHTSGTLQCVDRPYDYLASIVATGADYILFNRLGFTRGSHDVITVHESWLSGNGPGPAPIGFQDKKVRYPFAFCRESAFYDILQQEYDPVVTFADESGVFPVGDEPVVGIGLLAKRKKKNAESS